MKAFTRLVPRPSKAVQSNFLTPYNIRCTSSISSTTEETTSGRPNRPSTAEASNLMEIGTRRIFSEEHDIFRQSVRRYFREQVTPEFPRYEVDGHVGKEAFRRAGEYGLLGVHTPAELGGLGGSYLDACIVMEEQMYVNDTSSGFSLHSNIVMPYVAQYGTPEQIQKYIPAMNDGTCIGAIAMTEPGAGSDLQGIRTNAKKDGDDWILNGSKIYITNGFLSDMVIVVARTDLTTKNAAKGISLFLVDKDTPGVSVGKVLNKMGMKGQDTCELFFEDVRLPKTALLGKENQGFLYLMQQLPAERLLIGVICTSSVEFMFEEARTYVKDRKAFGRTVADLQTVQHKLAEMKTSICIARSFTDECIEIHNERGLDSYMASMVKYWTSDLANKIGYDATQLHGGAGFMMEYPITRAFASARAQSIYGGTNEIMKELIARQIVKE